MSFCSYAQNPGFLLLPKGLSLDKVSWRDSIYRFPSFQPGTLTFSTGFTPDENLKLNYNLYLMRIELIEPNGDTAWIQPSNNIKQISVGNRQFKRYESGFIEVIIDAPIGLGVNNYIRDEKREYWPYRRVSDVRGKPALLDRYYSIAQTFYFFDSRMKLRRADKPNILALMREHRKEVDRYVDDHKIDFNNEEDLRAIVHFCNNLKEKQQ